MWKKGTKINSLFKVFMHVMYVALLENLASIFNLTLIW